MTLCDNCYLQDAKPCYECNSCIMGSKYKPVSTSVDYLSDKVIINRIGRYQMWNLGRNDTMFHEMDYNEAIELSNKLTALANEYAKKVNDKRNKPFMLAYYGRKMREAMERLAVPRVMMDEQGDERQLLNT